MVATVMLIPYWYQISPKWYQTGYTEPSQLIWALSCKLTNLSVIGQYNETLKFKFITQQLVLRCLNQAFLSGIWDCFGQSGTTTSTIIFKPFFSFFLYNFIFVNYNSLFFFFFLKFYCRYDCITGGLWLTLDKMRKPNLNDCTTLFKIKCTDKCRKQQTKPTIYSC